MLSVECSHQLVAIHWMKNLLQSRLVDSALGWMHIADDLIVVPVVLGSIVFDSALDLMDIAGDSIVVRTVPGKFVDFLNFALVGVESDFVVLEVTIRTVESRF